jgi:HK97 gp10 family phage protein
MADIDVEELEETLTALQNVSDDIANKAIKVALLAASVPVLDALVPNIPVHSGDLRGHLAVSITGEAKDQELQIGFPGTGNLSRWLEIGHLEVGHAPQKKVLGDAAPRPFMRPALEESKEAAVEAFKISIDASIDASAQKNGLDEKAA